MENEKQLAVVVELIKKMKESDSWCGETHVQKTIYLLQSLFDINIGYEYSLYKHGPYSFELKDSIQEMITNNCIDQIPMHPYGPSLHVNSDGEKLLNKYDEYVEMFKDKITFIAKYANKPVSELEKLSTAMYVDKSDPNINLDSKAKEITSIKPHISVQEAKTALGEIEEMKLASSSAK